MLYASTAMSTSASATAAFALEHGPTVRRDDCDEEEEGRPVDARRECALVGRLGRSVAAHAQARLGAAVGGELERAARDMASTLRDKSLIKPVHATGRDTVFCA